MKDVKPVTKMSLKNGLMLALIFSLNLVGYLYKNPFLFCSYRGIFCAARA